MATYHDEAAIIKAREIGEADKIFTLFGKRKGRFSAIAKSVRKLSSRKMGHLTTGNVCKIACAEGKSLDILLEAEAIITVDPTKLSVLQHEYLGFCGMLIDRVIPEGISDPAVFGGWCHLVEEPIDQQHVVEFILLVLKNQGFLNDTQAENFIEEKFDRYAKLQRYVSKILDTI